MTTDQRTFDEIADELERDRRDAAARTRIDQRLDQLEDMDLGERAWYRIRQELERIDELGPYYVAAYLGWAVANPKKVKHGAPRNP